MFAHRSEAGDVREEYGDNLPLGSIEFSRCGRNQIGYDARIDELTKCVLYFLSGADFFDHSIKGSSELPDLIIGFDGYRDRKMTGLDRRCPFGETA